MPVIRVDDTKTTTVSPEERAAFLEKLKGEFEHTTEDGPVIFEIPLGTDCFDVLVVWEKWADWPSEERSPLILEAYDEDKRKQIAQVMGVTYNEAIQQQLLPYTIVSPPDWNDKTAWLVCNKDENEVLRLRARIREAKLANGGMVSPIGKAELRFPTRAMADQVLRKIGGGGHKPAEFELVGHSRVRPAN